jgi:hypothetical protein
MKIYHAEPARRRRRRPRWISIGDEIDKFLQFPAGRTSAANEADAVPGADLPFTVVEN